MCVENNPDAHAVTPAHDPEHGTASGHPHGTQFELNMDITVAPSGSLNNLSRCA